MLFCVQDFQELYNTGREVTRTLLGRYEVDKYRKQIVAHRGRNGIKTMYEVTPENIKDYDKAFSARGYKRVKGIVWSKDV